MTSRSIAVKGIYYLAIYLCLMVLGTLVEIEAMPWISKVANWVLLPLLILFFYINTDIDTKFEKQIFFGLLLFSISPLLYLAAPILGNYAIYIILALMIIGYFSYARALIAITSIRSTLFFQKKSAAGMFFLGGLIAVYFFFARPNFGHPDGLFIPLLCFGLSSLLLFMATVNLYNQLNGGILTGILVSVILLLVYNCGLGLNISPNISIFASTLAVVYYLGQLVFVWTAVRASIYFKNQDHSSISNALKNKVVQ